MKKLVQHITGLARTPLKYSVIVALSFVAASSGLAAAISWPAAPSGEPTNGLFMNYISKMLVNSDIATTDGKVKKSADADGVGSGTLLAVSGSIGIGTSTPGAKLEVVGGVKATSAQITTGASSGTILVSDASGNASWQANNYRLTATGFTENIAQGQFNCNIMADTSVRCSGYNGNGELGIGDGTSRTLATPLFFTGAKKLVTAANSAYALLNDGTVYSWGYNNQGHLGLGDGTARYYPVKIPGLTGVTDLVVGRTPNSYDFVCAQLSGGTVKCWGYNGYGQLGDGTATSKSSPTDVIGLSGVVSIKANGWGSAGHVCALINDGTVKCWGYNAHGQVGDGSTTNRYVPTTVPGLSSVRSIYVFPGVSCAVLTDNVTLKCWGYNGYGQLGDGTTTNRSSPITVSTGGGSIKELTGSPHDYMSIFILFNDGTIRAAGYSGYGQLGNGDTTQRNGFTPVTGISNATKVVMAGNGSYQTTCALLSDGTVKCWGYNGYGELGDGTTATKYLPTPVLGVTGAVDIKMSGTSNTYYACVLMLNGSIKCWGYNGYGALSTGDTNYYTTPVTMRNLNAD